jgi:YebC/PmpR family DNA-binding regulatory protein
VAVKEGAGATDPDSNFKLRLIIEKARSLNMPKENIERAIEKAAGVGSSETMQEVTYEAFGPEGVGIIIEAVTNNKQRTVSDLKNVLERGGGVLAASGAVVHLFDHVGRISIPKNGKTFDEVMEQAINTGAIDIEETENEFEVYTLPSSLHKIKESLQSSGITISSFELYYRPKTVMPIQDKSKAQQILQLLSSIEDLDDVQKVFANFDIPDQYLQ